MCENAATEAAMEDLTNIELLQRYRRDRYDLLNFVLSSGILEVVIPPGALSLEDVDLDQVNVEFVLESARKRKVLELQEAVKTDYVKKNPLPKVNLGSRDVYFLITDPELSGSPPARPAPQRTLATSSSLVPTKSYSLHSASSSSCGSEDIKHCIEPKEESFEETAVRRKDHSSHDLYPLLSSFVTGLSEEDLRETAYEVLLASVGGAVGLISPAKDAREEHRPNLSRRLSYETQDKYSYPSTKSLGLAGLLDTMRIQLEISKSTDRCIKEALLRAAALKPGKRMDSLLIPVEFLFVVSQQDFESEEAFHHWRKRQLRLLEEGLLNHPAIYLEETDRLRAELKVLINKVDEVQDATSSVENFSESLKALEACANALSERPREGDQIGEFFHWADGYHLNVRIYEMLLCSIFDIVNEGDMVEEAEEIIELLKSTWHVLGISQTVHDLCFTWVLFRQFCLTGNEQNLFRAAQQIKKITLYAHRSMEERAYMQSLQSRFKNDEQEILLTYFQSLLIPMKVWVENKLEDYHKHFSERLELMDAHLTIAVIANKLLAEEATKTCQGIKNSTSSEIPCSVKEVDDYITSAIKLAYGRVLNAAIESAGNEPKDYLILLADGVKSMVEKELGLFLPVLCHWNNQSLAISASLIYTLLDKNLNPFVGKVTDLTDDIKQIIQATSRLENSLKILVLTSFGVNNTYYQQMSSNQLEACSSKFIVHWIESQLKGVVDFVQQSILEEDWNPISTTQRQSKSIVYVFDTLQEVLHQFFSLHLPMRIHELRSLIQGLDKALKLYCNCILSQIGTVEDLMPPVPHLTRHGKEAIISFSKKKVTEEKMSDDVCPIDTSLLSTVKLCIRLNSLHYILYQVDSLEVNIKEQWEKRWPNEDIYFLSENFSRPLNSFSIEALKLCFITLREGSLLDYTKFRESKGYIKRNITSQINEELSIGFSEARKVSGLTLDKVCEFTGTKIIFFDMRESFINGLYRGGVASTRIRQVISGLDLVLGELLENIVEPLREQIVMGLLRASLNGLLRVLLDGGPSRAFSQSDGNLLLEDLQILKDFFIADGDGLPRALVEAAAEFVNEVVDLYRAEIINVIQNFKNSNDQMCRQQTPQRVFKRASRDFSVLLRILCHRTEHEASKFLRKHQKFLKSSH